MPNSSAQGLEHISSLNDSTRRAFYNLLDILEGVAPGIRGNILWVLKAEFKEKDRETWQAGPNYSLEALFELPDPERFAAQVLIEQKGGVFGRGQDGFDLFPNGRRLRLNFFDPIADSRSAATLTVHAGDPADYHAIDKLAISFEDKVANSTDSVRTEEVKGRDYLNQSGNPTRLGKALAQTLRGRIEFLNRAIQGVREKVANTPVE